MPRPVRPESYEDILWDVEQGELDAVDALKEAQDEADTDCESLMHEPDALCEQKEPLERRLNAHRTLRNHDIAAIIGSFIRCDITMHNFAVFIGADISPWPYLCTHVKQMVHHPVVASCITEEIAFLFLVEWCRLKGRRVSPQEAQQYTNFASPDAIGLSRDDDWFEDACAISARSILATGVVQGGVKWFEDYLRRPIEINYHDQYVWETKIGKQDRPEYLSQ